MMVCFHVGYLLSGDCNKNIHLWKPVEGGTWQVDQRPFHGHTSSVEDVQWSPNEANVRSSHGLRVSNLPLLAEKMVMDVYM